MNIPGDVKQTPGIGTTRELIQDLANLAPGLRFIPATIDLIR